MKAINGNDPLASLVESGEYGTLHFCFSSIIMIGKQNCSIGQIALFIIKAQRLKRLLL